MQVNEALPVSSQLSFKAFLFTNKRNRFILVIVFGLAIIQLSLFKYFYPYASFIHDDSFLYLETAYFNLDIHMHMIGYGKFLRLFSVFTHSDTALVIFQYLFIQCSALFFLFTLFYFYEPGRGIQIVLLCFILLNPLFLYLANMVSSDALFLAFSLIWFTLLLWIIKRPCSQIIVWHAVVLFVVFMIRYNALIYPFISSLAFLFSRLLLYKKIIGITLSVVLCGLFILYTGNRYRDLTGTWQYSPFSGWQLANNAMYAYRYVSSVDRKPVPVRFKALDEMIRAHFDSTRDVRKYPMEALQASTFYMWDRNLPLYKYRDLRFGDDSLSSDFKKWVSMGPFYKDYGLYIIKEYPSLYLRYFIWPNTVKYFKPPGEYLETYNGEKNYVRTIAQDWFRYKSSQVSTRYSNFKITMLDFYPIFTGIMNIVFLCSLISFIVLKELWDDLRFHKAVLLVGTLWFLNAVFSILSTAAALRFMAFPIIIMSVFTSLMIDWLLKRALNPTLQKEIQAVPEYTRRGRNA